MNTDDLWDCISAATGQIVCKPEFARIVRACPYFEGWWMVELAQRFAEPDDLNQSYHLRGFDILAVSERKVRWQPDLLLDHRSNGTVDAIVWVELKQLNLIRKGGSAASEDISVAKRKLRAQLRDTLKKYCDAWTCARAVKLDETAAQWEKSKDLQNFTLDKIYRQDPRTSFLRSTHLAAAFLLAVVPPDWDAEFNAKLDKATSSLGQLRPPKRRTAEYDIRLTAANGDITKVYLVGLLESFRWAGD